MAFCVFTQTVRVGQWTVNSEQWTVSSEQKIVNSREATLDCKFWHTRELLTPDN
jgi:hypothetical protein